MWGWTYCHVGGMKPSHFYLPFWKDTGDPNSKIILLTATLGLVLESNDGLNAARLPVFLIYWYWLWCLILITKNSGMATTTILSFSLFLMAFELSKINCNPGSPVWATDLTV